ncbi:Protein CBG14564 [Caenorhabditis briggsae]|uniref:Protein CBG14564 n=1 Tax=Caenorhabditis briggsae TaxID=6238 RepID=A8XK73_CAEBR|nr:Protein CBG14564 [Caenorhabditis briggsae]CAP33047.2 Protein CBG14564 [Caenorhabditis briggsae]
MVIHCASHRSSTASAFLMPDFSNKLIKLEDKYEYNDSLDSMIGMGAFGAVFKGNVKDSTDPVAIKRMLKVHVKESELKLIKELHSEYLVGVLDICNYDDFFCCLIMELCDCDLDHHMRNISEKGRLNQSNFRQVYRLFKILCIRDWDKLGIVGGGSKHVLILREERIKKLLMDNIARGYKALYELKIVHRDIKPQNILITYTDASKQIACARITDFGIARTLDDESEELCNVAGTFYYMAPEVGANLLKTCQYDSKVDMWSIGCLLYQCVTGEVPFDECSLCKLFLYTAGANFDAYDPPELPVELSQEVSGIIQSLLQLDTTQRCTPTQFYDKAIGWSQQIC